MQIVEIFTQIFALAETWGRKITYQIWNYLFIYNSAALTNQAYIL